MSDAPRPNYVQHLNVLHGPGEKIDVAQLVADCTEDWYNQTLAQVNESVVRLGVLHGEYHWHRHEDEDEFFFVLSGRLEIELEDADPVVLGPQQGYVVAKGRRHRPLAPVKTVLLMVETAEIDPLGT